MLGRPSPSAMAWASGATVPPASTTSASRAARTSGGVISGAIRRASATGPQQFHGPGPAPVQAPAARRVQLGLRVAGDGAETHPGAGHQRFEHGVGHQGDLVSGADQPGRQARVRSDVAARTRRHDGYLHDASVAAGPGPAEAHRWEVRETADSSQSRLS
ncbi:hypothetical protein GCM10010302_63390 [Streptomyces polychromogenes]|uniref:Uncharacterized protein n=1 Tax=Streptomyces polychromogenes TaxID=67342 RepID=A0ABN0VRS3_9ACTN